MVWRYGPEILRSVHKDVEACEEPELGEEELDGWRKWARLNRGSKILSDKLISAYFLIVGLRQLGASAGHPGDRVVRVSER